MLSKFKKITNTGVFNEVFWYSLAQVFVQGMAFFGVIYTSRYLGPTNVGLYSFVQNYVGLAMSLVSGADFYFSWKIAKSDNRLKEVKEYIYNKFVLILFISIIMIISAVVILPTDVAVLSFVMIAPIFIHSLSAFTLFFIVSQKAKIVAIVQVCSAVFIFCSKILLVLLKAPLIYFVFVASIDLVLAGFLSMFVFYGSFGVKEFLKEKINLNLVNVFMFFYNMRVPVITVALWQILLRVDQLVLATFSNAYSLGIYSAAVKISEVPNFLSAALYSAMISRMININKEEESISKEKLKKVMNMYLISGVFVSLIIIILAPYAINILYGSSFQESVSVLRVYALSIPGFFLAYFFFGLYSIKYKQSFQINVYLLCIIVNVFLIYFLTPSLGLVGTALATVISYSLAPVLFYINIKGQNK